MLITWPFIALISCLSTCAAIEITRKNKLDGYEVLLYRCVISTLLMLPFVMYMTWPTDLRFYVMMVALSWIYAWGHIVLANLARRGNGRVAMMLQPLTILVSFVGWLIVAPDEWTALTNRPDHFALTLACFGVLLAALHFIRRNDYAWKALRMVAPIAIGFAVVNIAQKFFMNSPDGGLGLILSILMTGNLGMVVALPFLSRYRVTTHELKITHMAKFPVMALGAIAILHLIAWGGLLHAIKIAENPAYPVAFMALTPVIFQIYYWIRGWRDTASPIAGTVMAMAALTLGFINT